MNMEIIPSKLSGAVAIPSSKSATHRALICAGLARGKSVLSGVTLSKDIDATICALRAIGAEIAVEGDTVTVVGGDNSSSAPITIDCCESGSTLRFLLPIAAVLGLDATFLGEGKLPSRPITPYLREFPPKGVTFSASEALPFSIGGRLHAGEYLLEGDVSSQFITGLLLALPLCDDGDSVIKLTSPLQSKPYADLTLACLKEFGIAVKEFPLGYLIKGRQHYLSNSSKIEGDYSQAAFFFVANALGSSVSPTNINEKSTQGDKKILEVLEEMGYNSSNGFKLRSFSVDVGDIPDLVPILAVLGCFGSATSRITNAARLKIKESDRLCAIANALNAVGGRVTALDDGLIIEPVASFSGGTVDSCNDHRIAMAMAIAALRSSAPITIKNAEAVEKSYPDFFTDFNKLGGNAHVISLEP